MPALRLKSCILLAVLAIVKATLAASWPNGPFSTSSRWITDASGNVVNYVGVNWPGHIDAMIPEGLQYQSISTIVSKIKSINLNSIRLTYAIQMIDEIEANSGKDTSIRDSFIKALGQQNGTTIYNSVVKNNANFNEQTTRLDVFDAVVAECNRQQIYVHLDNHVSKAGWCCTPFDGNSWWGDTYFSTANWTRGLAYMANHGKSWPNLMSMSLRNELRQPLTNMTLFSSSYNWQNWYSNIQQGAKAIHGANPNVLVFLSGLDSDTTLQPVVEKTALTPGTDIFDRDTVTPYPSKLVLELHNYANINNGSGGAPNYPTLSADLDKAGFSALYDNATNPWPIVVTEFGYPIDDSTSSNGFVTSLLGRIDALRPGWQQWSLGGSYYIREGQQDYDESWALLNHDWSDWRSQQYIEKTLKPLINDTLAIIGRSANGSTSETDSTSTTTTATAASTSTSKSGASRIETLIIISILTWIWLMAWL